ncbi:MAG: RNA-guided endonuclease TnpB family protein [Isosphaeraceae bacterium]
MATHRKVYRFRMRPTRSQEQSLNRLAGARRWVWNWGLARWKETYAATGKSISLKQLSAELTALKEKPETAWLKEADSQSLQQVLNDLHRAFTNFFEKRARYPRFKSKKRDPARFRIPQRVKIADGKVYVPKVGQVRIRQSRPVEEKTKSATFRRSADGKWYVSLTVEFDMPDIPLPAADPAKVVGIDLGLKAFATITGREPIPSPQFFRKGQRKLRKAQRVLSRRKPGSKRRARAKVVVARVQRRIANQRGDFLHKLTTQLVNDNDGICIEDLSLKGLARTKLAKSFTDASMGEFRRQLTYKSEWNRKHLVVIDRFFPSSRLCRGCGAVNGELTLSDRHWVCRCGMVHDRDGSAAINIRDEGLRILAEGHSDKRNARGAGVRPPMEAVGVEPRIPRL